MKLAKIWSEVLSVPLESIGRSTSFFALGGDSMTAIQLISSAKEAGLGLTSTQVFKSPTLSGMCSKAKRIKTMNNGPVTGNTPLSPIQRKYFETKFSANRNHHSQTLVFKPQKDNILFEVLTSCLAKLIVHHDMLRCRYSCSDKNEWTQIILKPEANEKVNAFEYNDITIHDMNEIIEKSQSTLDITNGPLYAVSCANLVDGSQRIIFTVHSLVIDRQSWIILINDVQNILQGLEPRLKTTSYKDWIQNLIKTSDSFDTASWNPYMFTQQQIDDDNDDDGFHFNNEPYTIHSFLDATSALLIRKANSKYRTTIEELVLTGLAMSLSELICENSTEVAHLCLELEGQGRYPWNQEMDASNSVGWFSVIYPILFSCSLDDDIFSIIEQVKEKMRNAPDHGISFGALKYFSKNAENIRSHRPHQTSFKFVESFDSPESFLVLDDSINVNTNEVLFRSANLICLSDGRNIEMKFNCIPSIMEEDVAEEWLELWKGCMTTIIEHCVDDTIPCRRTYSDVPLLESSDAVEECEMLIQSVFGLSSDSIDDIYPATALQKGFISAMMQNPSEYTVQQAMDLQGDINMEELRQAWLKVAEIHPILRTIFISTRSGIVQAVTKDDHSTWTVLGDIWPTDDTGLKEVTAKFMNDDRKKGFTMQSKSFNRFTFANIAGIYIIQ
jgi:non-ribosomal peptide synthase protein (TIGR01720 family)